MHPSIVITHEVCVAAATSTWVDAAHVCPAEPSDSPADFFKHGIRPKGRCVHPVNFASKVMSHVKFGFAAGCAAQSRSRTKETFRAEHPITNLNWFGGRFPISGVSLADLLPPASVGCAGFPKLLPWSIGVSDDTG